MHPHATAHTTANLVSDLLNGNIHKSADREWLVDGNGNKLARRIATNGAKDFYEDINQTFDRDCIKICLSWQCDAGTACICVEWGCQ